MHTPQEDAPSALKEVNAMKKLSLSNKTLDCTAMRTIESLLSPETVTISLGKAILGYFECDVLMTFYNGQTARTLFFYDIRYLDELPILFVVLLHSKITQ